VPETREQLRTGLQQLTQLAQRTLESLRLLALQLRPAVLDDLGLHAALRWLTEDCRERLHLSVSLHLKASASAVGENVYPPLYETTLFRVAQESLTNVARHAQATHVSITLVQDETSITLRIHDDGQGELLHKRSGLGISGMQERVSLLNGTLLLFSEPGKGTMVEAVLPLPPPTEPLAERKAGIYA
jgi:two-component system sensor histidine kinase UhpB